MRILSVQSLILIAKFFVSLIKLNPSPPPRRPGEAFPKSINFNYIPPSNYDWLPSPIIFDDKKTGTYIKVVQNKFKNYFKFIDKWNFEIGFVQMSPSEMSNLSNRLEPIAINKSGKIVAGSLMQISDRKEILEGHKIGMVHLLPPLRNLIHTKRLKE